MLKLTDIKKDYYVGDQTVSAVKGISLEFEKNQFVAITGASGCGKTTLMNIIGGLDKYTSGDLIIDGRSTKDFKDKDWDNYRNKKIGFIFQSYNLIPHLSVLANVELALTISGMSPSERSAKAKKALESVGLNDHFKKKPNQMSGGQMQRVAIARAIVNEPDILLADEPTGALDTKTSEQIMNLIKDIAKDKQVIMVTHNLELAEKFSNRIIRMQDGVIIEDRCVNGNLNDNAKKTLDSVIYKTNMSSKQLSNVAEKSTLENTKNANVKKNGNKEKSKTSMSFFTALSLSFKNLFTKKARTILTAVAGSIGIVGIALIMAISSGMNNYINKIQMDTLSGNPITVSATSIDMEQAMNAMGNGAKFDKFPSLKKILVEKTVQMSDVMTKNNITTDYIKYIKNNIDKDLYNDIVFKTGLELNFYGIKSGQENYSKLKNANANSGNMMMGGSPIWQHMLSPEFLSTQYDVLEGKMPQNKNEVVLFVDEYNKISESTMIELGIKAVGENIFEYNFDEILTKKFKVGTNDLIYQLNGSSFVEKSPLDINFENAETIRIVGIVRINQTTEMGVHAEGIGYLQSLYEYVQNENLKSEIVAWMSLNPNLNPNTGIMFEDKLTSTKEEQWENSFRKLGGSDLANDISIYAKNFTTKNQIKEVLNDYNVNRPKEQIITYMDMSELMGTMLSSMVNVISYVLIGFTAISLLVSCVMIGIITYVSVLERTKEIGILRSIGARKKDVTRVFNAETFIIGFIAGLIGIGVTLLASIPINILVKSLTGVTNIASLPFLNAVILVVISILLTLVSGLIPARLASKKDPVTALRTD